ncbi:MAG: hypothetical protein N2486_11120 [Caloramator sp.]|nr:hypothetical protein [Caloramator sp.]
MREGKGKDKKWMRENGFEMYWWKLKNSDRYYIDLEGTYDGYNCTTD